jgi:hypothetical protein
MRDFLKTSAQKAFLLLLLHFYRLPFSLLLSSTAAAAAPAFLFMYICWIQKGPSFSYPGFICCLF